MNAKYIVYTSQTGHSQRYARMLSEELDISAISLDEAVRSIKRGTEIIYVGWLFANSIKGYKKANRIFSIVCTVAVGLCPTGELLNEVRRANAIPDTFPLFTVQGGMDREKLRGINKFMINTLIKLLKNNRNPSDEDREKLRLIKAGGDFVSNDNLSGVLEFCKENGEKKMTREFGKLNGKTVNAITIKNEYIEAEILSYGATLRTLKVKDKNGDFVDVCLGYDTLEEYVSNNGYFGATVGRVANRIGNAHFTLDGKEYTLAQNNGKNTLHGGKVGFNKAIWHYSGDESYVTFFRTSPDGEEGFPGNMEVSVTYTLKESSLEISYKATSDKKTPISLTNHSYFNLGGHSSGTVYTHTLKVNAVTYTEVDEGLIPTGTLLSVEGTALDLRCETSLEKPLLSKELDATRGIDHNYALNSSEAATMYCPETGICMDTVTTLEGIQIYTAGGLGERNGKNGAVYSRHNAVCLETQHFPDAINKPSFNSCVLSPNEVWEHKTAYVFSVK